MCDGPNPRGGDHCPPSDNTAPPATAVRPKAPPRSSHPETAPACSSAQTSHNSTARPMSLENTPSASSFYFIQTKRGSHTCADIPSRIDLRNTSPVLDSTGICPVFQNPSVLDRCDFPSSY